MLGQMQNHPLLISALIDHAARHHGDTQVVSRRVEGDIHRYTWGDVRQRAKQVAKALDALGLKAGDRVGTLAWNGYRHLELYFGVSGSERVLHTINPRLLPEQIAWIVNHAEDRVMMTDITFVPLLEKLADKLPSVERFIVLTDKANMPQTTLKNAVAELDAIALQHLRNFQRTLVNFGVIGADDGAFDRAGDDLLGAMILGRVLDNPVAQQRPILHQTTHPKVPPERYDPAPPISARSGGKAWNCHEL